MIQGPPSNSLDYRTPPRPRPGFGWPFGSGIVEGLVLFTMAFYLLFGTRMTLDVGPLGNRPVRSVWLDIRGTACAVALVWELFRADRRGRRARVLGLLTGVGLTLLLMGACFAAV